MAKPCALSLRLLPRPASYSAIRKYITQISEQGKTAKFKKTGGLRPSLGQSSMSILERGLAAFAG
jgi:hypothetical protein